MEHALENIWHWTKFALFIIFSVAYIPLMLFVNFIHPVWEKWSEHFLSI